MLVRSIVVLIVGVSVVTTACFGSERHVRQETVDLFELPTVSSSVDAKVGDRLEVSVEIEQRNSFFGVRCGTPSVFDPFGNELAVLSAMEEVRSGDLVSIRYEFAFFPAADGEYTLGMDNRECAVREEDATATVTWTVHGD